MNAILENQVALVTGGTRGIGRAIATTLAEAGATVVITGRDADRTSQAASEIAEATGGKVEGAPCDVSNGEAVAELVADVAKRLERLDILVNNAGITRDTLIARMKPEDWQAVIDTNLTSVFTACKAAARIMGRARSGRIINITSVVGLTGNAGQCNYAASKAGIIGFSKSLAREIGGRGVTVNAIAPGFIATDMTSVLSEDIVAKIKTQIPLGDMGKPEDIAAASLFLASPAAGYITGETLRVDGGMAM